MLFDIHEAIDDVQQMLFSFFFPYVERRAAVRATLSEARRQKKLFVDWTTKQ